MEEFNKENMLKWLNGKYREYQDRFNSSKNDIELGMLLQRMAMIEDTVTYITRTYIED